MRQWLTAQWKNNRVQVIAVALVGALALFLRLYDLGRRSLWLDEILQARCITPDWNFLLTCLRGYGNEPPLPYLATFLFYRLAGSAILPQPDWLMRLPSVIAGLVCVPLAWKLGDELLGRRAAWLLSLLWSIVPLGIDASQQVRQYSWFLLFCLATTLLLVLALRRASLIYWVAWGISAALAVYSSYTAFLFLAGQAVFTLVWLTSQGWLQRSEDRSTRQFILKNLLGGVAGVTAACLSLAVWFRDILTFFQTLPEQNAIVPFTSLSPTYAADIATWLLWGRISWWDITYWNASPWLVAVLAIMVLLGLIWMASRSTTAFLFSITLILSPLIYLFLGKGIPATPRFLLYLFIPYSLVLTASVVASIEWLTQTNVKPIFNLKPKSLLTGLAVILLVVSFLPILNAYYNESYDDWRGVADYLQAHAGARDVILGLGPNASFPATALSYYLPSPQYTLTLAEANQLNEATTAKWTTRTGKAWGVIFNQGSFTTAQLTEWGAGDFLPLSFGSIVLLVPQVEHNDSVAASAGRLLTRYRELAHRVSDSVLTLLRVQDLSGANLLKYPDFGDIGKGVSINWQVNADTFSVFQEDNTPVLAIPSTQVSEGINIIQRVAVVSDQLYVVRFDCRNFLTTGTQRVYVTFTTSSNELLVFPGADGYTCPSSAKWNTGTIIFRAPSASDAKPEATLWLRNFGVGTVYFRNVSLTPVTP